MVMLTTTPKAPTRKLERLSRLVDEGLTRVLPRQADVPPVMREAMLYCVFPGGKRFRPLLCLGAAEAVGATARQALPVATAMELIHTYSLVHDDLPAMDNADERRGRPACHRKFGEGNAILIGDALLTLAFELLGRNGTRNGLEIVRVIAQAGGTTGLIGGQVMDLQAISHSVAARERTLLAIAERKTGALITASVIAGALAGGATAAKLRQIRRYGETIGLAFQLIDDLHDQEGLARVIGQEQACAQAQRLIQRGLQALAPFGRRAEVLRALAGWLETTGKMV